MAEGQVGHSLDEKNFQVLMVTDYLAFLWLQNIFVSPPLSPSSNHKSPVLPSLSK